MSRHVKWSGVVYLCEITLSIDGGLRECESARRDERGNGSKREEERNGEDETEESEDAWKKKKRRGSVCV